LVQAIEEGQIDTKGLTPDRPNPKLGEPDHDFVLKDQRGRKLKA
jgi:hypothetical protein